MASITPLQCLLQVHTPQHKHPKEKPPILFSLFCQSTFPLQTLLIRRRAKALDFAVFWQQVRWWTPLTSQTTLAGHGPPAPAFLSFTTHVPSPALLHPKRPLSFSPSVQNPHSPLFPTATSSPFTIVSLLPHCHRRCKSLDLALQTPSCLKHFHVMKCKVNFMWLKISWAGKAFFWPFCICILLQGSDADVEKVSWHDVWTKRMENSQGKCTR